jgi:anti-sigma factor RsiW
MTAPRHVDVGAYVLGILDEPDEAAYEEHFAQCERCRREFIEMADLPAILDTMKPAKTELKTEPRPEPQPALPPLDQLIDFRQLASPGQAPPGPSVPPQLRPTGATQPHKVPPRTPTNGARTNGHAHPAGGHPLPAPDAGLSTPTPRAEGTGRSLPVSRAESTGRSAPVSRAESTGRSAPVSRPDNAGPASRAEGTGRSLPVSRAEGTGRSLPPVTPTHATRPAGANRPPSTSRARRRSRNPVWLAAAAVVAVAVSVGMVIGLTSGGSENNQVANPGPTPTSTTSPAVGGAHVVTGTDAKSGATAIIAIEPVDGGTDVKVKLYRVNGKQDGEVFVISRFGDRERISEWKSTGASDELVRSTGVSAFPQHDISRFEIHGDGLEPLVVVPI